MEPDPTSRPTWSYTVHAVIHEFLDKSSIHGAQYVVRSDFSWSMRVLWLATLGTAGWGAWATCVAFLESTGRPVDVTVHDTNIDNVKSLPFPAVVVCPVSSIRRSIGIEYIRRYLSAEQLHGVTERQILNALQLQQSARFPFFRGVLRYTWLFDDSLKLTEFFPLLNITDLAIKAMPQCEDIFVYCFWNVTFLNCCEIFHLQFTEFGLCYSFNSYSSNNRLHCELDDNLYPDKASSPECFLKELSSLRPYTDLKIAVKAISAEEMLVQDPWFGGYFINAFAPTTWPEPINGFYMSGRKGHLTLQVSRFVTLADSNLHVLPPESRKCWYPSEKRHTEIVDAAVYTSDVCALECRLLYLAQMCNCRPYMVKVHANTTLGRNAVCKYSQMNCLANNKASMWSFTSPPGTPRSDFFDPPAEGRRCSQCWPACVADVAEVHPLLREHQLLPAETFGRTPTSSTFAPIDMDFENLSVSTIEVTRNFQRPSNVYLRREHPESLDSLATYGGIANLFLGVGFLTIFETLYFLFRGLAVFLQLCWARTHNNGVLPHQNTQRNLETLAPEKF